MIIANKYNEYLVIDNKIHHNETKKYNLFKYIYDFILNFTKKYNLNFDINLIILDDKASINNLKNICDNLLEDLYDIFIPIIIILIKKIREKRKMYY